MYISDKIEVREIKKSKLIFAIDNILKNEIIFEFEKNFINHLTRTSMQIDERVHQECSDSNMVENFLSHSCTPNGYINFLDLTYRALRNIKEGEKLTFNYLTTDWDLANKFDCECDSQNCYGQIRGFKYLTEEQQTQLKPLLSPFLRKKIEKII